MDGPNHARIDDAPSRRIIATVETRTPAASPALPAWAAAVTTPDGDDRADPISRTGTQSATITANDAAPSAETIASAVGASAGSSGAGAAVAEWTWFMNRRLPASTGIRD